MILDRFFKTRKLYMLAVLPFLLFVLMLIGGYLGFRLPVQTEAGSLLRIGFVDRMGAEGTFWFKGVGVLLAAYLMIFGVMRHHFLAQETTLPGSVYLMLTSALLFAESDVYLLVAVLSFVNAYTNLQGAVYDSYSNRYIFNVGFFISLTVLFYPKLILLLVWAFVVLFFSGRSTIKDIVALLLGYISVGMLFSFYNFWFGHEREMLPLVWDILMEGQGMDDIPVIPWLGTGVLFLILLSVSNGVFRSYTSSVVNQRRAIATLISSMVFLLLTVLLIPGIEFDFIYILAVPLSYYYAQYFVYQQTRYWGDVMFALLGIASLSFYFW